VTRRAGGRADGAVAAGMIAARRCGLSGTAWAARRLGVSNLAQSSRARPGGSADLFRQRILHADERQGVPAQRLTRVEKRSSVVIPRIL
jgi:hypothetical protein